MKHHLPIKMELPEHFLDEEVRFGYMVSSDMKKVWAVQIDLLFEFKRICDKYNIRWFAGGGTMLGAARHSGYIPWDDDIDIDMLREDYERFRKVVKTELSAPYFYTDGTAEKGTFRAYSQLYNSDTTCIMTNSLGKRRSYNQGISIDIFPVDNMPDTDEEVQALANRVAVAFHQCGWLYSHMGAYNVKKGAGLVANIKHIAAKMVAHLKWPFQKDTLPRELERIMQSYNGKDTDRVGDVSLVPFHFGRLWKREWYDHVVHLPFEWFTMNVPCGYDQWLTTHYGNWHEYVVGTSLHQSGLYDPEKPYKYYVNKKGI